MTVGTQPLGGGSSAVAASSHAACARFRGTDPLITGLTRRRLAKAVGHPGRRRRDPRSAVDARDDLRATRPRRAVRERGRDDGRGSRSASTARRRSSIVNAHDQRRANGRRSSRTRTRGPSADGSATLIHGLAVPFVGFEESRATDVKPDFAVVAPKTEEQGPGRGSIVGDAKDYERLRSRIDDTRLLKGFLQVARWRGVVRGLVAPTARHGGP